MSETTSAAAEPLASSSSESNYSKQLQVALEAAKIAGKIIVDNADKISVSVKSGVDLVTQVDQASEKAVIDYITKAFPNDLIIGEEDASASGMNDKSQGMPLPKDQPVWCVDPLDGTTNFVHQYPLVCVSIGYCAQGGVPVVGVIYNPFLNQLYHAEQGQGAYCNGRKIHVDQQATDLSNCLLVNNIGHTRDAAFIQETTERVAKWLHAGLRGFRSSGSAAQNMAHVATGQISAFYEHGYGGPWDVCAGYVLVKEAGGVLKNTTAAATTEDTEQDFVITFGKGSICCGNALVVKEIIRVAGTPKVSF